MRIKVNVTARDIKYGKPYDIDACPVARAIKRTKWGRTNKFEVGRCLIVSGNVINIAYISWPDEVNLFITEFDFDGDVKPFTFEMDVPE